MNHEHHHPSSIESSNNNKLSQSSPSHHTGHNQHIGHNVEMFRNKFWVCLIISIPVLLWDPMIQQWFKYQLPSFPGSNFIPAVFGTIVFIYGGWVFLQGAYQELAHKTPGMICLLYTSRCV